MNETTQEKIAELLNEASVGTKDTIKISNLKQIQELILQKEPDLLDNFLEEILQFQLDKSNEVKKLIVAFIEESCKRDPSVIVKVVDNLRFLLYDENVNVQKRAYLALISIFKNSILWLSTLNFFDDNNTQVWDSLLNMKNHIIRQLDSENDGMRTASIKFIEMFIILTSKDLNSNEEGSVLDMIPDNHKFIKKNELINESEFLLDKLLDYTLSSHISGANLISSLAGLCNIVKKRSQYVPSVIKVFDKLKANLPPTLSKSQLESVKKQMKLQLSTLIKVAGFNQVSKITDILVDLGVSQNEIYKIVPKIGLNENRKRNATGVSTEAEIVTKRVKIPGEYSNETTCANKATLEKFIDELSFKLNIQENVVDLVLLTMVNLPEQIPLIFQANYRPVAASGTHAQRKHLASLLANQFIDSGLDLHLTKNIKQEHEILTTQLRCELKNNEIIDNTRKNNINFQTGLQTTLRASKVYKIKDITSLVKRQPIEELMKNTFKRMIQFGETAESYEMKIIKKNLLFNFAESHNDMIGFISKNIRKRIDIETTWIYHNYFTHKFMYDLNFNQLNRNDEKLVMKTDMIHKFESFLSQTFHSLQKYDPRDLISSKTLIELPYLPNEIFMFIRAYCENDAKSYIGTTILKDLITRRPGLKNKLLDVLLELTCDYHQEIRNNSIRIVKKLHDQEYFKKIIENFALTRLKTLVSLTPIIYKCQENSSEEWNDENIRPFLYLYLELLPSNHSLIFPLSQVYTGAVPEVKRTILRMLEIPIKEIGMDSDDILKLIEDFPQGCETLITRIIHILTEKNPPSANLVETVRDLYMKRISDVRFLVPVLNFLPKREIIEALPSIIKLSTTVVKEVFLRLFGYKPPITPIELLVGLHLIDTSICDLKTVINATTLCFAEKNIFTPDVLASVIQQLSEITPIPTLLMRTIIQTISMHPKLTNFIINVLHKLIAKQIWKFPKAWEGFIKCCQRTKPSSFTLLLQLPSEQFDEIMEQKDMKEPFASYLSFLTENQKASIPEYILKHFNQTDVIKDEII